MSKISDCDTGNPPKGWESEGQLRNVDLFIDLRGLEWWMRSLDS